MPRIHENVTICGRSEVECVDRVRDEIHVGTNTSFKCKCPYGCHDIKFEMELSSTPIFEAAPLIKKEGLLSGNASILQVYYQRGFYRSQDKKELIGFTEFLCKNLNLRSVTPKSISMNCVGILANIGGLLGLFVSKDSMIFD